MGIAPKKIKLNVKAPTSLKLRFGTPATTPGPVGGSIDTDSLRRQREETGQAMARAHSTEKKTGSTPVPASEANGKRSMSAAATPGIGDEPVVDETAKEASKTGQMTDAHQPSNSQFAQTTAMQPPQFATGAPPAGSHYGGSINLAPAAPPKNAFERDSPFDRVMRDPGKGMSNSAMKGFQKRGEKLTFLRFARCTAKWSHDHDLSANAK